MKRILMLALVGLLVSGPARAYEIGTIGAIIEKYDRGAGDKQSVEQVFWGLKEGLGWANTWLGAKMNTRIYCPPAKLAMTGGQAFSIFRRYVEGKEKFLIARTSTIGIHLLNAMKEVFPCK